MTVGALATILSGVIRSDNRRMSLEEKGDEEGRRGQI
jgi:hypothetical protein